jgi:aryl-alcohol dehydrogenase-like predicted oxidoreductase
MFGELIASGKVRHIGASNFTATQLSEALAVAQAKGLPRFETLQPHHNLVHRYEYEADLAPLCDREGIGVIPYSPLAAGFLTGKYRPGRPPPKSARAGRVREYMNAPGFAAVEALAAIAAAHNTTPAAVALAWQMTKAAISAPIIGANSPEQLADLLPAAELMLSPDEIASLDRVSASF